jgi:hypothetical protein
LSLIDINVHSKPLESVVTTECKDGEILLFFSNCKQLAPKFQPYIIYIKCRLYNYCEKATIGPSGVRALPLAAGINVGGHYKGHVFLSLSSLFLSSSLLILPEGVVVGFQIFAWAPKKK